MRLKHRSSSADQDVVRTRAVIVDEARKSAALLRGFAETPSALPPKKRDELHRELSRFERLATDASRDGGAAFRRAARNEKRV